MTSALRRLPCRHLDADSTTSSSKSHPRPPHPTQASAVAAASMEAGVTGTSSPESCRSRNARSARAPIRSFPCAFFSPGRFSVGRGVFDLCVQFRAGQDGDA